MSKLAVWMVTGVALLAAAAMPAQGRKPVRVTFGVYSFKRPTDVYVQFRPAVRKLQEALDRRYPGRYAIELEVRKTYEECLEAFVKGEIDFVRFGPASYVLAKQRNPAIELLAIETEDGKKECHGVIAVRAESPIRTLTDLKGKKFAFGDSQSTIGRYLSQAELVRAGVFAKDLAGYKYVDRHDIVYDVVEIGDYDAGALHIATFTDKNKKAKDRLRELARFRNIGKPWIARAGLDPILVRALRESLLGLADTEALKALKVDGFAKGVDSDYEYVREGMQLSERFDPQPEPAAQPKPPKPPAAPPNKGK